MDEQQLQELLEQADKAYKQGQLGSARHLYEQVLAAAPGHAFAHSRVGAILAQGGELAGARAALEQALELDPALAAAHSNLGNVFYTQGDYAAALERYQKAAALDPNNPVFHDNLHAAFKKLGQLDKAVAAYKKARSLERTVMREEARETMGRARRRLGCGGAAVVLLVTGAALVAVMAL